MPLNILKTKLNKNILSMSAACLIKLTPSKFECSDKKNCTLNFMIEIIKY